MKELIAILSPLTVLVFFIIAIRQYSILKARAPSKGYSSSLGISTFICVFINFFSFFILADIENEWRSIIIVDYRSHQEHENIGTEDYYSFYRFSSRDPYEKEKINILRLMILSIIVVPTIVSYKLYTETKQLEDWEFKAFADYNEKNEARRNKDEWYKKHPNRIKPA